MLFSNVVVIGRAERRSAVELSASLPSIIISLLQDSREEVPGFDF